MYAHILSIIGDADAAADETQETLLTIARKLSSLRDPRWFRAWAYRIATRRALRTLKDASRWTTFDVDAHPIPDYDKAEVSHFDYELLEQAIARLSPASQLVVRMHYLDELSITEIAEALEISAGTVKSRLSYGLGVLRSDLGIASARV